MNYQRWNIPPFSRETFTSLHQAGFPALLAAVLSVRGTQSPDQARAFLDCSKTPLHDPFLMKDMDRAVDRIHLAIERNETICVYGDYDVDGVTSTCLLSDYLLSQGVSVIPYIPDRMEEGYGLNDLAIESLSRQGVSLMITVDCGITAVEQVEKAAQVGMDVVITDHHHCQDLLPEAAAIVNPQRPDCAYPFSSLAGVGVALKLVLALGGRAQQAVLFQKYVALAAVGTIADVMDLTGENRMIVMKGLEALPHVRHPGFRTLLEVAGANLQPMNAGTVSYTLAPRINAAGRMGQSETALQLLMTENAAQAEELALQLCQLNRDRQEIEGEIFQQCVSYLESQRGPFPSLVLAGDGWHQGVVGIVASRLAERYSCPVFMICLSGENGKGSCRSFGGFNLFSALEQCSDLLVGYGGHEQAAGFNILRDQIDAFRVRMNQIVTEQTKAKPLEAVLHVDLHLLDAAILSVEQVKALDRLEPCGSGNPKPVFALKGAVVLFRVPVGNGKHLKLRLRHDRTVLEAIYFGAGSLAEGLLPGDRINIAFTVSINHFRGTQGVQLQLCDLRRAPTKAQAQRDLLQRLVMGGPFSAAEASAILPTRQEFELVWRYLKRRFAQGNVEDSPAHLSQVLSQDHPASMAFGRTMVCIRVFHEGGLIQVEKKAENRLCIQLQPYKGKIDLEQSELLRLLHQFMQM